MHPNSEVHKWFHQAAEDLRFAKYGFEANPPFLKGSAFHAQQCAEKAIKAFLILNGKRPPKSHDLRKLSETVSEIDSSLTEVLRPVSKLTKYVTASRYPTEIVFDAKIVKEALEIAETVYNQLFERSNL